MKRKNIWGNVEWERPNEFHHLIEPIWKSLSFRQVSINHIGEKVTILSGNLNGKKQLFVQLCSQLALLPWLMCPGKGIPSFFLFGSGKIVNLSGMM